MNNFKTLILLITSALLTSTELHAAGSNKIQSSLSISDSKISKKVTLSDDAELNRFHYIWSQKQAITKKPSQGFQWRYQLVITNNQQVSRWVYDPRGFVKTVNLQGAASNRVYKLASARAFNRYIENIMKKESNN